MDKYEYKVRADEIKDLISRGEYVQAVEIADTIDWRRVKSIMMLCTISDLYKINRRYEDARDMLLLAYERRPGGRTICYSLCELSIKMEEYVQAIEYYKEFVQVAPKDPGRYILQYKLYEAQDVSLEERIAVLEELKKRDYREKWAYELAYLYHRIGLVTRCVEECDELILWFGEGKYVYKAMELKRLHEPLTPEQQMRYDARFAPQEEMPAQVYEAEQPVEEQSTATREYAPVGYMPEEQPVEAVREVVMPEPEISEAVISQVQPAESEEMDIQVKTMDMGQYNTINLQAELAAGLREVLAEEKPQPLVEDPITRTIMAPMLDSDTESLDYPEIDEVSEEDLEPTVEEMESTEVFFGETAEIGEVVATVTGEKLDNTAEIVMNQLRQEIAQDMPVSQSEVSPQTEATPQAAVTPIVHVEPPKALAGVLSQESDGQLSLVMPESENIEKQITGQMSIEDILAEWERIKKANQEKREEEIKQRVLQHTGSMFTEFEAAVRDGLLEQLEREKETEKRNLSEQKVLTESDEVEELEEIAEEAVVETVQTIPTTEEVVEEVFEEPVYEETFEEEVAETASEQEFYEETITETVPEQEFYEETVTEEPSAQEIYQEVVAAEPVIQETNEEPVIEEAVEEEPVEEEPIREKAKLRSLTKEEKELFGPYIQSKSAKEQLVKVIDNISLAAYTGNVILTGAEGTDTMTLAKNLIREIQRADSNFSGKVAKISGITLNNKDVAQTLDKLQNGALIISKASEMNDDTAMSLYRALQKETMGIIIIMEDVRKAMDKFLADNKHLYSSFTARMDIEALSNDSLVAFGKQYAREREYSIDDLGILALHTRIEEMQTIDHVVTVMEVKEIVDEAIRHVNRKTLGHFFDVLLAKRYDDEDMIILTEKDFV